MYKKLGILLVFAFFVIKMNAAYTCYYVSTTGTSTASGLSPASATNDLQKIFTQFLPGDTVKIAKGDYLTPNGKSFEIIDKWIQTNYAINVVLLGGWSNDFSIKNPLLNPTYLKSKSGHNASILNIYRCNILIDGIIFQDGNSTIAQGGGINNYAQDGGFNMVVRNCIFRNNKTTNQGGGVCSYNLNGNWYAARNAFINCTFEGNSAVNGGGIHTNGPESRFYNCTFINNFATVSGAAIHHVSNGSDVILSCTVVGNKSQQQGGGINSISSYIYNSIIAGNKCQNTPTLAYSDVQWAATDWGGNLFGQGGVSSSRSGSTLHATSAYVTTKDLYDLLDTISGNYASDERLFPGKLANNGGFTPTIKLKKTTVKRADGVIIPIDNHPYTIPTSSYKPSVQDTVPKLDQTGRIRSANVCSGAYEYLDQEFTNPGFVANWKPERGGVELDMEFYKYKQDTRFKHDLNVQDIIVEYTLDKVNYTALIILSSTPQTAQRGTQYRSYSVRNVNAGTQIQIWNKSSSLERWETLTNATDYYQASAFSNSETFSAKINWQLPTELLGKKIYVRSRIAWTPMQYRQELNSSPASSPVAFTKQISIAEYGQIQTEVTSTVPQINTTAVWQNDGTVLYSINAPTWMDGFQYNIEENGKIIKTDYFSTKTFSLNYSSEDISKVKKYLTKARFSPNSAFSNFPQYTLNSNETVVKAYALPVKIYVTMDGCTQKNTVSFDVPAVTDIANCVTSNFELCRAEDESFNSGFKVLGTITYDASKTKYTYTDPEQLGVNQTKTIYYKLRRIPILPEWDWNANVRVNSVIYNTTHKKIKEITAGIDKVSGKPILTWQYMSNGIFCSGSKIAIYRSQNGLAAQKIAEFTDEKIATYLDETSLPSCTPLIYSIEIGSSIHGFSTVASKEILVPLSIADQPSLKYMKATKGYFNDRVELEWKLDKGSLTSFRINRKLYEESGDKYVTIAEISATASQLYKYNDIQTVPSRYYSYQIEAINSCNGKLTSTNLTTDVVGFRMPTGSVSGRVVYLGDVPVDSANIIVQGADQMKNRSLVLGSGYVNIPDSTNILNTGAFSIQAWLKLADYSLTDKLIDKGSQFILQRVGSKLQIVIGSVTKDITNFSIPNNTFFQLSIVANSSTSFIVYINGKAVSTITGFTAAVKNKNSLILKSSVNAYLDEFRIWDIALTSKAVSNNYDRYIAGNESGLKAYYRLDEKINEYIFDMSSKELVYNENHGVIIGNCPRSEDVINVPSSEQLSLKGKTDANGNYLIGGIPYFADGTSYTFTPQLGTHEFNPKQRPLFLGDKSSVQNNVDFVDVSSFKFEGVVVYSGGNYPVEGVSFLIDGQPALDSRGVYITTDSEGKYSLSVPIGNHTIQATKQGHIFSKGKYTTNFQQNYVFPSGFTFEDGTLIKLIGRVVGGKIESDKGLLIGQSKNNIGKATIVMEPLKKGYDLRSTGKTLVDSVVMHDNGTLTRPTKANNTFSILKNQITIKTSPATGEFIAYVYPEDYSILETKTSKVDLLDGKTSGLYLKSQVNKMYEVSKWTDTITVPATKNQLAYKKTVEKTDSIMYHAKYIQTLIVDPEFSITELDSLGKAKRFWGDSIFVINDVINKTKETLKLVTFTNNTPAYTFGNPVFTQSYEYTFKINAFEKYMNADDNSVNTVPVKSCNLLVDNTMKVENSNTPELIELDSLGRGLYTFMGGAPDLTTGIKKFDANLIRDNRTFSWNDKFNAILLGGKSSGNNFTTSGPNQVIGILRDPPGSNSYSYLEKGHSVVTNSSVAKTQMFDFEANLKHKFGFRGASFVGIGAGIIFEASSKADISVGLHIQQNYSSTTDKVNIVTTTKRYETSPDELWVGADADLFIGYATNILYGTTNSINIVKNSDLTSSSVVKVLKTGTDYSLVQGIGIAMGQKFATEFAYTQRDLEQIFIPAWVKIRNNMLLPKGTVVNVNNITKPVYVSLVSPDEDGFGSNNNNKEIWGNLSTDNIGNGPSYKIYLPASEKYFSGTDSIIWCNNQIKFWKRELQKNEQQKYESKLINNQSFTSGSKFEYSNNDLNSKLTTDAWDVTISGKIGAEFGVDIQGFGIDISMNTEAGGGKDTTSTTGEEYSNTVGFVLQETGDFDAITVDYKRTTDGGISFSTRGGQTSCPFEGAVYSKYFQPGTILSDATMQIEIPKISVVNAVMNNVPANRDAVFELELKNESDVKGDIYYMLSLDGTTNPNGAILKIDGAVIDEGGRTYLVRSDQVLKKTLTITKGPNALDFNNIRLYLSSVCQSDPTDFTDDIYDEVLVSAHFIPNCSEISMTLPQNNWVMNTSTEDTLVVKLENYDVNYANFGYIALQTKASSSSVWNEEMKFFANSTLFNDATGAKTLMEPTWKNIQYKMRLPYADNKYDVRAVAYCIDPTSKTVIAETPTTIATGVKDMVRPTLFGLTQPSDGILNTGDEIQVQFNEDIAQGLITHNNISVTGIKNGTNTIHTAAVNFDGTASYMSTEQTINLAEKSFTIECWLKRNQLGKGTIISHGGSNGFEFGFNQNNKLYVKNGATTVESTLTYSDITTWNHYSAVYDADLKIISVYVNGNFSISDAPFGEYTATGVLKVGANALQTNYLVADVHELRLWDIALDRGTLSANKSSGYNGIEQGMIGYWKMNEGKGKVAFDISRGRNAAVLANWTLNPSGKSIDLTGTTSSITINTAQLPVSAGSDYTIELWFKGAAQTNVCLFSAGRGDGDEYNNSRNNAALWFNEKGLLTFANNGKKIELSTVNYLDNLWHHVAVSINRLSTANFYVDGILVNNTDARAFTTITASEMHLGMRKYMSKVTFNSYLSDMYFKGKIDEFRIWNTSLTESLLNKNINTRLQGNESGLAAYYSFDNYANNVLTYTLNNQVEKSKEIAILSGGSNSTDYAPIKIGNVPEKLGYEFTTSNDKINIKLTEQNSVIERTSITVSVSDIQDKNENILASPISWDVYIDRCQLKWENNSLIFNKAVNTELTFSTKIVNSGATNQKFEITNNPTWMSVEPSFGTVKPGTSQDITFVVDKGLNIGAYDENLYLRSDYNEPLSMRINVLSEVPDWNVDPGKYSSSMNLVASLKITDVLSVDKNDKVAVFINGECCGVSQPVYIKEMDKYLLFMKVYGNETMQNSKLIFKVFDASSGHIFSGKPDATIYFVENDLKGTPSTPILITAKDEVYQSTPLNEGWTWISVQVASTDLATVQGALAGMKANSGDIIKNNALNAFDAYSANTRSWIGTLTTAGGLNNSTMYFLKAGESQTLSIAGTVINPLSLKLDVKGAKWNYLSYLPSSNISVKEAMAGYIASTNDILKSQDAFVVYDATLGWIGDLKYMEPGKGYMLYRSNATDVKFNYPVTGSSLQSVKSLQVSSHPVQKVNTGKYDVTMNVIASVSSKFGIYEDDLILGYKGTELVSVSEISKISINELPLIFNNINANNNSDIHFILLRNGKEIARSFERVNFVGNTIVGSLKSPLPLNFNTGIQELYISAYPNPAQDEIRVQINTEKNQRIELSVKDLLGKVVIQPETVSTTDNFFETSLNISKLNSGVYFVNIKMNGQIYITKVAKK